MLVYYLLNPDPAGTEAWSTLKWLTIVVVILFSSIARLASSGNSIILERDWIVVISADKSELLAGNSQSSLLCMV